MKHFSESFSGTLKQYMAVPEAEREQWLENQPWYQKLPNDSRYKCQACGDTGLIISDSGTARRCPCVLGGVSGGANRTTKVVPETYFSLDALLCGHWEGWPVPRIAESENISGFIETESFLAGRLVIEEMHSGTNRALVLCGNNGRGKTFTGLQVISEAAWSNKKSFAIRMSELILLYKGGTNTTERRNYTMNRIYGAHAVLIDEVGAVNRENDIDHNENILVDIVHTFHKENKILVLTSNNTKKELIENLPPSIISRIGKNAKWCIVVEDTNKRDLRGLMAA